MILDVIHVKLWKNPRNFAIIASFFLVENNRNNVTHESIINMFTLQEVIQRRSMLIEFIKWKKNVSIFWRIKYQTKTLRKWLRRNNAGWPWKHKLWWINPNPFKKMKSIKSWICGKMDRDNNWTYGRTNVYDFAH